MARYLNEPAHRRAGEKGTLEDKMLKAFCLMYILPANCRQDASSNFVSKTSDRPAKLEIIVDKMLQASNEIVVSRILPAISNIHVDATVDLNSFEN
ncbi:16186_t:CDS:2 [Funneliformis mosseae]|uniref:16186_t:CDS:1 n=1 Tax=Funneliformis mosseae TaxID=27381 RepID=A0A9N8W089_FUNMO|nr:16186_t:CDS:2 [Funneliformis mosseae]